MRPLRLGIRFLRILGVVSVALSAYGWRRIVAPKISDGGRELLRGTMLARCLERLGATFIKFGQILSTRPDLIGPGYVSALSRLQDRVPPEPYEHVRAILDEDLPGWSEQIVDLEPEALAAASVAQVHRGRLANGEAVAIKVQRPGAPAQIERDLALLRFCARILEWIPSIRLLALRGAVERFGEALHRQLDFVLEAENNRRFAEDFRDVEGVAVPRLYPSFCTRRVLTMELIDGVRATDPERVGGDRRELARRGLDAILRMVFRHGFVHADMHPGNLLLTHAGGVVLIDLGLVAEIPDDMKRPWVQTFMALATQDGRGAARLFYGHAPHVDTPSYAAYEAEIDSFFLTLAGKRLGEVESSVIVGGVMNILRRHRVQIDPVFTVVNVALLVAEGIGKQLDPTLDVVQLAVPYLTEALASAPEGRPPRRDVPETIDAARLPQDALIGGRPTARGGAAGQPALR